MGLLAGDAGHAFIWVGLIGGNLIGRPALHPTRPVYSTFLKRHRGVWTSVCRVSPNRGRRQRDLARRHFGKRASQRRRAGRVQFEQSRKPPVSRSWARSCSLISCKGSGVLSFFAT
jgi:hypothetical protein